MIERQAVRRYGWIALGLYVLAFVVLSTGGALRSDWVVGLAVGLLFVAAVLLQLALSRDRNADAWSPRARLLIPIAIIAGGLLALGAWWAGTELGYGTGGVGLGGVCAMYLGAGQLLAEVRAIDTKHAVRDGAAVSVVCGLAVGAGLAICLGFRSWGVWVAAAGLLFAPVGLTLVSEGVLSKRRSWTLAGAIAGPFLIAAAVWLLRDWLDLGWTPIVVIGLGMLVLVGAIASNTQADVLLVVTAVGLFWAATPHGVAADDETKSSGGSAPALVALGDSYISGEGASVYYESTNDAGRNECRRSPHAYPRVVVDRGDAGDMRHLTFLACSGAKAADVVNRAQWRGEPIDGSPRKGESQLQQLGRIVESESAKPRLVVVSIGGNDAGFANIAAACLAPGTCVERGQRWLDRLEGVAARIDRTYAAIRGVVGEEVPVLAVPYPVPISDRACGYSQLRPDEHRFLNGFVEQLDGAIRRSAGDAGFYFLDEMVGALGRKDLRICDAPEPDIGVNVIRLKSLRGIADQVLAPYSWLHNSLHPNEKGHDAMANVLASWISAHPRPPAKPDPRDRPGEFTPADLDEVMEHDPGRYCGHGTSSEPRYCDRDDSSWALTKVAGVFGQATPALALLVLGSWLLWLPVLRFTRPRFSRLGNKATEFLFR